MAALLLDVVAPARGHHSIAVVDFSRILFVQGTVERFEWAEPHAWVRVATTDEKGQPQVLAFQCFGPAILRRRGWTDRSLQPGQTVRISYFPYRAGRGGGALRTVTLANGAILAAYDFPPRGTPPP